MACFSVGKISGAEGSIDRMGDLWVTIGISGSGKSYLSEQLKECFPNTVIVSTDAIRKRKWGDENDQREPEKVFADAYKDTETYLAEGFNVVFDSTALKPKYRKKLIDIAGKHPVHAIFFDIDVDTCINNDKERGERGGRTVGADLIKDQKSRLIVPSVS